MIRLGVVLSVAVFATGAVADDSVCASIVQDTLAELRAGSTQDLDAGALEVARAAAGSACVKAMSGRYLTSETISTSATGVTEESVKPASTSAAATGSAASEDDAEESSGFKITPKSGSPSKKGYDRSR